MTATAHLAAPSSPLSPSRPQRGFVLWVGVDPDEGDHRSAEIIELAEALGELARELLPTAETYTALSLGETGRGGQPTGELGALRDRLAHLQLVERTRATPDARPEAAAPATSAVGPRLSIDLPSRRVTVGGVEQRLTYTEFELLAHLVTSAGRVVPRSELFASVWQSRPTEPGSRTIDVHVRRLRDKLGLQHEILTVRGTGYRFELSAGATAVEVRRAG